MVSTLFQLRESKEVIEARSKSSSVFSPKKILRYCLPWAISPMLTVKIRREIYHSDLSLASVYSQLQMQTWYPGPLKFVCLLSFQDKSRHCGLQRFGSQDEGYWKQQEKQVFMNMSSEPFWCSIWKFVQSGAVVSPAREGQTSQHSYCVLSLIWVCYLLLSPWVVVKKQRHIFLRSCTSS